MFEKTIAITLVLLAVTLVSSFFIALVGYSNIRALGKEPSQAAKIILRMLLLLTLAEGGAITALLVVFKIFKGI